MDVTLLLSPLLKWKAELASVISMKLICYIGLTPINSTYILEGRKVAI